jgi:hypothetical protein
MVSPRSTLRPTVKRGGRLGRVSRLVDTSRVIAAQESVRPIPTGDAGLNRLFNLWLRSTRCGRSIFGLGNDCFQRIFAILWR